MVQRNPRFKRLPGGYLFPEINRRKNEFLSRNPAAKLISLGIGNTTEPLTPYICEALQLAAKRLGTTDGYSGYGEDQGNADLRQKISSVCYGGRIKENEIFVSDGAKCDIGRLQLTFGADVSIAVQDPSYPVYIDGGVMIGQTGEIDESTRQFDGVRYLRCDPDNNFFPDLEAAKGADLIYFCSPNNPTGAVATKEQLTELVRFATAQKSIIIFDAAYSTFIQDEALPRSIYEIPGAEKVAIEVQSFSKSIGFTGVRLGWSVVPEALLFDDGSSVRKDWARAVATVFNCASNIAQAGGLAALDDKGLAETKSLVSFYMKNTSIIRQALTDLKVETYGGQNAPYLWARFPGRSSWESFEYLLEKAHVITTPGVGFGPAGEGFVRFSAFGHRESILEAVERINNCLG